MKNSGNVGWRSRIVGHGEAAPADLVGNPRNWRTHPKAQRDALAAVLDRVGWVQDVIVNRTTGHLVDGHARLDLARQRGEASVPVVYVELDADEEALVLATLDPLAAMAETDDAALRALIDGVTLDDPLRAMLDAVVKPEPVDGLTDPDDVPEPVEDSYVQRGDLYQLGAHRIMCGDSTDAGDVARLLDGVTVDITFTSPPYALGDSVSLSGNKSRSKAGSAYLSHDDEQTDWAALMRGWYLQAAQVSSAILVNVQPLAGNKRELLRWIASHAEGLVDIVTWDKGHAAPQMAAGVMASRYEWIIILSDDGASRTVPFSSWRGTVQSVYAAPPQRQNEYAKIHAATFPVHLPEWVMSTLCDRASSIYDPLVGSGTTIIAAERTGRRCYAMEIEPRYVQVAITRWEQFTGRKAEKVQDAT